MRVHNLVALFLAATVAVSVQATPAIPPAAMTNGAGSPGASSVEARPKRSTPLAACVSVFKKDGDWVFATFRNGARYGYVVDESGLPVSYTYTAANGDATTQQVNVEEVRGARRDISASAGENQANERARAQLSASFMHAINENCKRNLISTASDAKNLRERPGSKAAAIGGGSTVPTPMDIYSPFSPEYNWIMQDFENQADGMIDEEFFYSMSSWENQWYFKPTCNEVVSDCKSTCDRVGAFTGGVMCTALGAAAGTLTAGIGIAVGAYCAGKVFIKTEECRNECVVTIVPCT